MRANVGFALFVGLLMVFACVTFLVAASSTTAARSRAAASRMGHGVLLAIGVMALDIVLYGTIREAGIRKVIERGHPIVTAIGNFERDTGRVPETLEELVPKYLATIPTTDAAIDPEFSYSPRSGSWELAVGLTQWILDDSRLLYHSDQKYGGCAYRYGAWALSSCG